MNESTAWALLKKKLREKGLFTLRVEDKLNRGVPDVYWADRLSGRHGWIEMKFAKAWPKRRSTPVRLKHYTAEQKLMIRLLAEHGVPVHLYLRVEHTHMLFPYPDSNLVGEINRDELFIHAGLICDRFLDADALYEALTS